MEMPVMNRNRRYTYADYITWDEGQRWELIDGAPYAMASPSVAHQRVIREISGQLWQFLKGKPCEVFIAPLDVRLYAAGDDEETVVQPDILVVCDLAKLDGKGVNGAPDLAVEIVSPATSGHDRLLKFNHYLRAGVREYWIVDPGDKTVAAHVLRDGEYTVRVYADAAPVHVLENFTVDLTDVFAEA
jgi:Uma2 family endonuclease